MLDVPGVINLNHTAGGDNFIIQTSSRSGSPHKRQLAATAR
jgi:hypothetical protein